LDMSDLARHDARQVIIEGYNEIGYNYRMTDLQAAVGLVQLGRLDGFLRRRRELAARYTARLSRMSWLVPPAEPADCQHNFQSYVVRLRPDAPVSRDRLMQELLERGVSTRRGIMAIHREAPYHDAIWRERLPETELAADQTLILPLFHQMTEEEQDFILDCVTDIGSRATK